MFPVQSVHKILSPNQLPIQQILGEMWPGRETRH